MFDSANSILDKLERVHEEIMIMDGESRDMLKIQALVDLARTWAIVYKAYKENL